MVNTIKFSEMTPGGNLTNGEQIPGLLLGGNVLIDVPWTFLAAGATGSRPAPVASIYYRLRLNTTLQVYEYYDPISASWVSLSGSINPGVVNNLAYYAANGTTLSPLATANSALLLTSSSGVPAWSGSMTNGQLIIGSTGATPNLTTLTPGAGISITNAAGSITIASTGAVVTPSALTKTDDTNVTLTLGGTPATALLQATSLNLGWSGQLSLVRGGTNASLVASNGGIVYSNATGFDILSGTATANRILMSGSSSSPSWSTATYPSIATGSGALLRANGSNWLASTATFADTYAASALLYSNGANTVTGLATTNSASLITNSTGVPVWSSTMTNGQVIIGSTGATPTAAVLTAGTGISITNAAGSITIANTGSAVTPAALTKVDDTNITLTLGGAPATALLQATSITAGWSGTLSGTRGGTGVNNGASTATYAGNLNFASSFTTAGAFAVTQTYTGATNVTFPTSGTLATTSQLPTPAALTKTDDTNVTLTLGGTPATSLLQATSLTLGWTGQLGLTRGGTNASLTASNGGIVWSNATQFQILSGTATAGQILRSGASAAPSWSTATYPATAGAVGNVLTSDGINFISSPNTGGASISSVLFLMGG
jgi:hypothetical protein